MTYIVICRDDFENDDFGSTIPGGYVLATRLQFISREDAIRYAGGIAQGREPIVVECPNGLTYSE